MLGVVGAVEFMSSRLCEHSVVGVEDEAYRLPAIRVFFVVGESGWKRRVGKGFDEEGRTLDVWYTKEEKCETIGLTGTHKGFESSR